MQLFTIKIYTAYIKQTSKRMIIRILLLPISLSSLNFHF
jgi:hypothetical protein